ncbi:MAG: type IV secretion system DNA-binding domain-containing protein [Patescibacteria group bacterium]
MHLAPTETPTLDQITQLFNRYHFDQIAIQVLVYLAYIVSAWIVLAVIFKLIILIRQLKESSVFLEITPPKETEITAISTTQLFNLINDLLDNNSWIDKILLRQIIASFEIVSTKEKGIRFLIRMPDDLVNSFETNLRTYIPGIQIKKTSDYLVETDIEKKEVKVLDFKLSKHFAFPIGEHKDLKKHDPLAYMVNNMGKLEEDELAVIQIVLKPLNRIEQRLTRDKIQEIKLSIKRDRFVEWLSGKGKIDLFSVLANILDSVAKIAVMPLLVAAEFVTGNEGKLPERSKTKIASTPESKEIEGFVKTKLSQPLFETSIRALIVTNKHQLKERQKGLISSFACYRHSTGQSITTKINLLGNISQRIRLWQFKYHLVSSSMILSTSEISALYHFPFRADSDTPDLMRVKSRELPAPLSLRQTDNNYDVIFGVNKYDNGNVPIGLTLEQRQKHMYIIGKTGMGKTTLLKNAIYQDMLNGKGLAVFDPHGDLLQELLEIIPENRKEDVIVFDPSDRQWPIGLNILAPGIKFTDKEDEQEWITSSVLGVFAKITAKEYWGPRMEHILRNTTLTALHTENPSLFTLQRLLTDKGYQKKVAANLKDPVLKQFWNKEFALLGTMQLSSVTAPLTQRLGNFITTKMSRHILLQEKSTVSVSQIMDEGKILLVNLSKGDLGEDMSFFFGTVLTSLIWMAAYQRTKIPEKERRDFFLYVDEFQNFATPRFSEITSEGRKYHVSLIASHQNIAQVEDQHILKVVAGNANTIICLKASPDDEKFILPFMEPEVEKGDIVNLPPYRFFMKLTNEKSENAFSGVTVPLDNEPSRIIKEEVLKHSRKHNATPRQEVEEYLDKLFTGRLDESSKPKPEVKVKTTKKKAVKKAQKVSSKETNQFAELS